MLSWGVWKGGQMLEGEAGRGHFKGVNPNAQQQRAGAAAPAWFGPLYGKVSGQVRALQFPGLGKVAATPDLGC